MPGRNPIWDLPTRLFHWALVVLIPAAWISVELGEMKVHQWCGYTALVLIGFRLVWGVVGSGHSRFADFVRGPVSVLRYFRSGGAATEAPLADHLTAPLPLSGAGEPLSALLAALETADAVLGVAAGTPRGVLSRPDVRGYLATTKER